MKQHSLPNMERRVSALCLGAAGFGTAVRGDAADRLTAQFVEAGGNFFDTAHCYAFWEEEGRGLGASETELGDCLRRLGICDQAVIATKGGHPDGGPLYPRPDDFLAERVIQQDIEESLNRLGMETIDLYYLHRDDGRTPVLEIMERLNGEIARGRIRHLGASNWSVERIAEANAAAAQSGLQGFIALQIQGSLALPNWQPAPDPTMRYLTEAERAWHSESGLPIVAYSATAGGYFARETGGSGLYDSPDNQAKRHRARELAAQQGVTPTQIALAYLMRLGPTVIPLFSTTNPQHLAEILGATEISLTSEQVHWLRDG